MNPEKFSPQSGPDKDSHENERSEDNNTEKSPENQVEEREDPEKSVGKKEKFYKYSEDVSQNLSRLKEQLTPETLEKIKEIRAEKDESE